MKNTVESELADEKSELEKLTLVLDDMERDFEELNRSFMQFQQQYSSEVGQKQVELNRLNAELAELGMNKVPTGHDVKKKSSEVETSSESYNSVTIEKSPKSYTLQEGKEAKKLYRKIAAIIHPDKATEGRSHSLRTKLMAELNEAYAEKDTVKMQKILDQWEDSPESVAGDGSEAELVRTQRAVANIKKRISDIETEISRIRNSDMYALMLNVCEAEKAGKDILAEMSISINAKIKDAQNKLVLKMYG